MWTNVIIRVKGDNQSEPWNVSRQRLSKCSESLADHEPWLGQSGKLRKRCVMKNKLPVKEVLEEQEPGTVTSITRRGCTVKRLARFMTISYDSHGRLRSKEGRSCKDQTKLTEVM